VYYWTESFVVRGTFTIPLDDSEREQRVGGLTLNSYIGGNENRLVFCALEQLEANPLAMNPVTFYGPTSTGKSTVLHGINAHWTDSLGRSSLLVNSVDFTRGFAHAIETGSVSDFRSKFQQQDLVGIDDLQLVAGKPAAQLELLYLLSWRIEAGLPTVFSIDRSPQQQPGLGEALTSRLAGGLVIKLQSPTPDTLRAILDQMLDQADLDFPVDLREALSGQGAFLPSPFTTVPELRHAIIELQEQSERRGLTPSLDDAIAWLEQEAVARKPLAETILKQVTSYFNVRAGDLKSSSRRQWVVRSRGVFFYLARKLTSLSYEQLGKFMGGRDHSTVMHACRRTESLIGTDPSIALAVESLLEQFVDETDPTALVQPFESRCSKAQETQEV
jgi:chromosomal replication initiator protein